MSKYATDHEYDGQRASVGRIVLLCQPRHDEKPGVCFRAGIVARERVWMSDDPKDPRWRFRVQAPAGRWREPVVAS
jgi:hypothetical protein